MHVDGCHVSLNVDPLVLHCFVDRHEFFCGSALQYDLSCPTALEVVQGFPCPELHPILRLVLLKGDTSRVRKMVHHMLEPSCGVGVGAGGQVQCGP